MDAWTGTILPVGFNYAPPGWALCDGSALPINQYQALFMLLGTQYGGDGVTTFKLPDLRGRVLINQGTGSGLQTYPMGATGGVETVTLSTSQMPVHTHLVTADNAAGMTANPNGAYLASVNNPNAETFESFTTSPSNAVQLNGLSLTPQGGSAAHENRQPYVTVNFIICCNGIFPSRQ